jgi:hypothetical protein
MTQLESFLFPGSADPLESMLFGSSDPSTLDGKGFFDTGDVVRHGVVSLPENVGESAVDIATFQSRALAPAARSAASAGVGAVGPIGMGRIPLAPFTRELPGLSAFFRLVSKSDALSPRAKALAEAAGRDGASVVDLVTTMATDLSDDAREWIENSWVGVKGEAESTVGRAVESVGEQSIQLGATLASGGLLGSTAPAAMLTLYESQSMMAENYASLVEQGVDSDAAAADAVNAAVAYIPFGVALERTGLVPILRPTRHWGPIKNLAAQFVTEGTTEWGQGQVAAMLQSYTASTPEAAADILDEATRQDPRGTSMAYTLLMQTLGPEAQVEAIAGGLGGAALGGAAQLYGRNRNPGMGQGEGEAAGGPQSDSGADAGAESSGEPPRSRMSGSRLTEKDLRARLSDEAERLGFNNIAGADLSNIDPDGVFSASFRGDLPTELVQALEGEPAHVKAQFQPNSGRSGGEDALAALGADGMVEVARRLAERGARGMADYVRENEGSPAGGALAALSDLVLNRPREKVQVGTEKDGTPIYQRRTAPRLSTATLNDPASMEPGSTFSIEGVEFTVEDSDRGPRAVAQGYNFALDGVESLPVDPGSVNEAAPPPYVEASDPEFQPDADDMAVAERRFSELPQEAERPKIHGFAPVPESVAVEARKKGQRVVLIEMDDTADGRHNGFLGDNGTIYLNSKHTETGLLARYYLHETQHDILEREERMGGKDARREAIEVLAAKMAKVAPERWKAMQEFAAQGYKDVLKVDLEQGTPKQKEEALAAMMESVWGVMSEQRMDPEAVAVRADALKTMPKRLFNAFRNMLADILDGYGNHELAAKVRGYKRKDVEAAGAALVFIDAMSDLSRRLRDEGPLARRERARAANPQVEQDVVDENDPDLDGLPLSVSSMFSVSDKQYPKAGERVDGRLVRDSVPNLSSIEASFESPMELPGVREVRMDLFTLDEEPVSRDPRVLRLAEEIRESGEINPLIVGVDRLGPYIVEGAHRYDALKVLGAKSFPAVVVEETPTQFSVSPPEDSPEFQRFFKQSAVQWGGGRPMQVYHGTTHEFDQFNGNRGNVENSMGAAYYFTDAPDDLENYANEAGPDLTNRVEREAERIAGEEGLEYDDEDVVRRARERVMGGGARSLPVYLSMQNPADLRFGGTELEVTEQWDTDSIDDEEIAQRVRENEGMDDGEPVTREDNEVAWDGAARELAMENGYEMDPTGSGVEFADALERVSMRFDEIDNPLKENLLLKIVENDGMSLREVYEWISSEDGAPYAAYGDDGALASGELFRQAVEEAGYDGIIHDAALVAKNMAGAEGATHYIVFKPEQIKSVNNRGTWDANDPRLLMSVSLPVDSPEFRRWFDGSQVVDENGVPIVVYHGTTTPGFSIFDSDVNSRTRGGIFFSRPRSNAATYAINNRTTSLPVAKTYDDVVRLAGSNLEIDGDLFNLYERDSGVLLESLDDQDAVVDAFNENAGNIIEDQGGIMPVYLNIKDPLRIDAGGRNWDDVSGDGFESTNSLVQMARNMGADGVIIENIIDEGPYGQGYEGPGTVYIALSPNQIKSATDNTGAFDPTNPDIRFSVSTAQQIVADSERPYGSIDVDGPSGPMRLAGSAGGVERALAGIERGDDIPLMSVSAWHGTPHDYDRFDITKIGTGEGAQAYGWGLYFADSREVAEWYRNALGRRSVTVRHDDPEIQRVLTDFAPRWDDSWDESRMREETAKALEAQMRSIESANRYNRDAARRYRNEGMDEDAARADEWVAQGMADHAIALRAYSELRSASFRRGGRLLKVRLAPAEDEYLLWDEPLEKQSAKVQEMVRAALETDTGAEGLTLKVDGQARTLMDSVALDDQRARSRLEQAIAETILSGNDEVVARVFKFSDIKGRLYEYRGPGVAEAIKAVESYESGRYGADLVVSNTDGSYPDPFRGKLSGQDRGSTLYKRAALQFGDDMEASIALLDAGVRGIKYLDGSSRGSKFGKYRPSASAADDAVSRADYRIQLAQWYLENETDGTPGDVIVQLRDVASQPKDGTFDTAKVVDDARATLRAIEGGVIEYDTPDFNYVIFDDADVEILEKFSVTPTNAIPGELEQENAANRISGGFGFGRPDLTNPAVTPEARAFVDVVDEVRNQRGEPGIKPLREIADEALAILNPDGEDAPTPNEVADTLIRRVRGGDRLNEGEVIALGQIAADRAERFMTTENADDRKAAVQAIYAYRQSGTDTARALMARRLMNMDPADIRRQMFYTLLMEPGRSIKKSMDKINRQMRDVPKDSQRFAELQKQMDRLFDQHVEQVNKTRRRLAKSGLDFDVLTPEHLADPWVRSLMVRESAIRGADFFDALLEVKLSMMLSGPHTHIVNDVSNTANMALEFGLIKPLEAAINAGLEKSGIGGSDDIAGFDEIGAMFRAFGPSFVQAGKNFVRAAATEMPQFGKELIERDDGKFDVHVGVVPGVAGRAVRFFGTNLLLAEDEFFKTIGGTMFAHGFAHREAMRVAREKGWGDQQREAYRESLLSDTLNPIWERAIEEARKLTFQEDNVLATRVNQALSWLGELDVPLAPRLLEFLIRGTYLPFIKTPANLFARAGKFTPISGHVGPMLRAGATLQDVLGGNVNPEHSYRTNRKKLVEDTAQVIIATSVGLALLEAIGRLLGDTEEDRVITGAPPTGAAERQAMYRMNAKPSSIKLFGQWIDYRRLDPLATTMHLGVGLAEAFRDSRRRGDSPSETVFNMTQEFFQSVLRSVTDKTFLSGIGDVIELASDSGEERKWQRAVHNLLRSNTLGFMPNLIRQPSRVTNPVFPERVDRPVEDGMPGIGRALARESQYLLPGADRTLPASVGVWGQERRRDNLGLGWGDFMHRLVSPFTPEAQDETWKDTLIFNYNRRVRDGVWEEDESIREYWPMQPYNNVRHKGVTYRLEPDDYNDYLRRRGRYATETLERVRDRLNIEEPTPRDIEAIRRALSRAGRRASREIRDRLIAEGRIPR